MSDNVGACVLLVLSTVVAGCAPEGRGAGEEGGGIGLSGDSGDAGTESGTGDEGLGDGGGDLDLPPAPMEGGGIDECASVNEKAELMPLPADIIFVVDNSGSMDYEAEEVQARMNDFSQQVIEEGVDMRVALISSYPPEGHGICIEPPLGGGGCPWEDNNLPLYRHIDKKISSHGAWNSLVYFYPEWKEMLRPEATTHFVVVTDDTPDWDVEKFQEKLADKVGGPLEYKHHSVVCHSDCKSAAGVGHDYVELSELTEGVAADLCDQDFQAVFDALFDEVVGGAKLACSFEIPEPPDGVEFDKDEVNLELVTDNLELQVPRVDSPAHCDLVDHAWYYDDPDQPTTINMCPQTCDLAQSAIDGEVNIAFGCETFIP